MIKYKLFCKDCSVNFDSWFSSSTEFEKVKRLKFLNCIKCGSKSISKSLMAPNIMKTKNRSNLIDSSKKLKIKNIDDPLCQENEVIVKPFGCFSI